MGGGAQHCLAIDKARTRIVAEVFPTRIYTVLDKVPIALALGGYLGSTVDIVVVSVRPVRV